LILSINTELVEKSYIRSTPFHHQPASMEQITVFNMVNPEVDRHAPPNISIHGSVIIAVTNNILIRCQIPEDGLGEMALREMARLLGDVREEWLAAQINHPQYIAGRYVDTMAAIYNLTVRLQGEELTAVYVVDFERIMLQRQNRWNEIERRGVRFVLTPRTEAVVDSDVADDENCAICTYEKKDDPSLPWVIAVGCSRHKYHRECLKPWRGFLCMTCSARLTTL
jgi:hypothetical protein